MEQFLANALCKGLVYALSATGFGLIYSSSRVFHIAHGAVYTIAVYFVYLLTVLAGVPLIIAVVLALLFASGLGLLIELVVYRPLTKRQASPLVLMISSLGTYIVLINLLQLSFGSDSKIIPSSLSETIRIDSIFLSHAQILQILVGTIVLLSYWVFSLKSTIGITHQAVADDPLLASTMGVNVSAVRGRAFIIGSALTALASVLMGLDIGMEPTIGFNAFMIATVSCIFGGLHRVIGPTIGALLLAISQQVVIAQTSAHWESLVTFSLLILVLLYRPFGLLGSRSRLES